MSKMRYARASSVALGSLDRKVALACCRSVGHLEPCSMRVRRWASQSYVVFDKRVKSSGEIEGRSGGN